MNRLLLFCFVPSAVCFTAFAQTDTNKVSKPPLAELQKFNSYLGTYNVTCDWSGTKWKGAFEWKPAIKNWYLQSTMILQQETKKIDRELRIMMTWDERLQKYRLWRFQTTPHAPPDQLEGEAKFVAGELWQEWKFTDEKGAFTFRNRLKMTGPDTLQIISEEEEGEPKKMKQVGITTCTRVGTKK